VVALLLALARIALPFLVLGTLDAIKAVVQVRLALPSRRQSVSIQCFLSVYTCSGGFKRAQDGKSCVPL
jgi:hypothetical protein